MKKISITILLNLVWLSLSAQTSMFQKNETLKNGETFTIDVPRFYSNTAYNEKEIALKYANKVTSNPLLLAMGINDTLRNWRGVDTISNYVKTFFKENCFNLYGATNFFMNDGFQKGAKHYTFFHKIVKVKKVREFGVKILGDMLADFCKYYPKDFKIKIINTIKECQTFVASMPQHKYNIIDDDLFIDGELNCEVACNFRGFILRRILTDKVPREEILGYLNNLLTRIQVIDVSQNKDVLAIYNVNNEFQYIVCAQGNYYRIRNKGNKYDYLDKESRKDLLSYTNYSFMRDRIPAWVTCNCSYGIEYYNPQLTYSYDGQDVYYTLKYVLNYEEERNKKVHQAIISNRGEIIYEE